MSDPALPTPGDPSDSPLAAPGPAAHFPGTTPNATAADIADGQAIASDLAYRSPSGHRSASHTPASLRHIDWGAAFPFVNIFKGFRLAVHPSKLLLALAGILLLYTGGRILDGLWMNAHQAVRGEAEAFERHTELGRSPSDFWGVRDEAQLRAREAYEDHRAEVAARRNLDAAEVDLGDIREEYINEREESATHAREAFAQEKQRIEQESGLDSSARQRRIAMAEQERDEQIRSAYRATADRWAEVTEVRGRGLFAEFYDYEVRQFDGMISSILRADLSGLLSRLYRLLYVGPLWGISQHPFYFTLFFLWFLLLAAVFGGAITRIAAVQVARDEKISLRSALRFSSGKFVSFLSAPLIPILIIAVVGLGLAVVGLIGNVPWLGELVISIGFILALLAGFLMTLVLIGLAGGFSLMYPTIAAEGTDSFDAISRSFSYLYARPWQLAFYALVGLIYASFTYLFVRLFIWLVLVTSHTAAGLFIWRDAAGEHDVLEAMWPAPPSLGTLSYDIPFINLDLPQDIGAAILAFWIYLIIALVPAFATSLYFSLSTVIYYLMRRDVDATELDEVYLDPHDEEFGGYADVPDADTEAPLEPPEPETNRRGPVGEE